MARACRNAGRLRLVLIQSALAGVALEFFQGCRFGASACHLGQPLLCNLTRDEPHHARWNGHAHDVRADVTGTKLIVFRESREPDEFTKRELPATIPVIEMASGLRVDRRGGERTIKERLIELRILLAQTEMNRCKVLSGFSVRPEMKRTRRRPGLCNFLRSQILHICNSLGS